MINLIKVGNTYNIPIHNYEVDETSELNQINNAPVGSVATVTSTGDIYKLRSTGEWTKNSSGGGSSPSGDSLPPVTNEGDVMTVVSGEWQGTAPQTGDFPVPFTLDLYTATASTTMSHSDIITAKQAGKNVYAHIDLDGEGTVYANAPLISYGQTTAFFIATSPMLEPFLTIAISYDSDIDNNWHLIYGRWLPEVNSSDNGKILKVQNSAWVAATPNQETMNVIFTFDDGLNTETAISDIIAAAQAHKLVIAYVPMGGVTFVSTLESYTSNSVAFIARFLNAETGTIVKTEYGLIGIIEENKDTWISDQI